MSDFRDFRQSLSSDLPSNRQHAVTTISQALASQNSPPSADVRGLAALLLAVYQHDASATVRSAAIHSPFFPPQAIAAALFDSQPQVRLAALRKLAIYSCERRASNGPLPQLIALISVESEENVLLEALRTLGERIRDEREAITPNQILPWLGHEQVAGQGLDNDLHRLESFGVIRDVSEHDSPAVRSAALVLLRAIQVREGSIAKQDGPSSHFHDQVYVSCFSILEELLQDTCASVQIRAVGFLIPFPVVEGWYNRRKPHKAKLSEKSAKCLLRLVEPLLGGNSTCGDSTMQILAALTTYPLATLSAYGLVETFLRRHLYSARSARIQNCENATERASDHAGNTAGNAPTLVRILEMNLRHLVKGNPDFVRVLDLTRSLSDKYGHLRGLNV